MPSSYYKLEILDRVETQSKGSKKIRRMGLVPGILYYAGEDNINIAIDKSVLFHAMQSGQRIFEIEQGGESQYTMIKQLQYHPVTDEIIHIDLMRVRRSEKITIAVPLVLIGEPVGVKEGGVLSQSLNQIDISCYPTDVPEQIELNIEDLELNSAKSVAELDLDLDDVEIVSDPSLNIVSITPPAAEEEVVEEELEDEDMEGDGEGDAEETAGDDKGEKPSNEDSEEKSGEL